MVEPVRHRRTKGAATDMFEPKATASHLDSTQPGHAAVVRRRLLLGVERTCRSSGPTSGFDPRDERHGSSAADGRNQGIVRAEHPSRVTNLPRFRPTRRSVLKRPGPATDVGPRLRVRVCWRFSFPDLIVFCKEPHWCGPRAILQTRPYA
jgi:hypothetical protein